MRVNSYMQTKNGRRSEKLGNRQKVRMVSSASQMALFCVVGMGTASLAQKATPTVETTPLMQQTFEIDAGGWVGFGTNGKASITHETANVKNGKSALQLNYSVARGEINALILPIMDAGLTKMKSMRFWVKTDYTSPVVVVLQEKDGGRYNSIFTSPGGRWQQVELAPSDFVLGDGKDDPKDPDGKLDLDKVDSVAIADLSQLYAQSDDPNVATIFDIRKGAHVLQIDDFSAGTDTLAEDVRIEKDAKKDDLLLSAWTRPQTNWIAFGTVETSRVTGKPLTGTSLKADYKQSPSKPIGLIRNVPLGKLAGRALFNFTVASAKPATLIIQLEERSGGKYNLVMEVPGDKEVREISRAFTDFTQAEDSHDDNGKLDLDQVVKIMIIDATGFSTKVEQDNTLWINEIRAAAK